MQFSTIDRLFEEPGRPFLLLNRPKNTDLVEDFEILLPAKFSWILPNGFRGEVENVTPNLRQGQLSCFSNTPEKHKLSRGRWDLASCQVLLNTVQWFQGRSQNYLPNQRPRLPSCFSNPPKNTNSVKDVMIFLPVKFVEFCSAVSEEKSTKIRWPPQPLVSWDIFEFSPENAERNSTKLDRKQDLTVLYQVFFSTDRKNKMAALASDWRRHFRHLPWNRIERNSTKLDGKLDLNVLYQVCVCPVDRKNKMTILVSDWLRHFRLLLWNYWTEFNETWQEARSQRSLRGLCFFVPTRKTRTLIGWDIFDFSETA